MKKAKLKRQLEEAQACVLGLQEAFDEHLKEVYRAPIDISGAMVQAGMDVTEFNEDLDGKEVLATLMVYGIIQAALDVWHEDQNKPEEKEENNG